MLAARSRASHADELDNIKISKRLRYARVHIACLSIDEASSRSGYPKGTIQKKENYAQYRQKYTAEVLYRFAVAYCVSTDYLIGLSSSPEGDPINSLVAASLRSTERVLQDNLAELAKDIFRLNIEKAENEVPYASLLERSLSMTNAFERFLQAKSDNIEELQGIVSSQGHITNQDIFELLPSGSRLLSTVSALKAVSTKLIEHKDRQDRCKRLAADTEFEEKSSKLSRLQLIFEEIAAEQDMEWDGV